MVGGYVLKIELHPVRPGADHSLDQIRVVSLGQDIPIVPVIVEPVFLRNHGVLGLDFLLFLPRHDILLVDVGTAIYSFGIIFAQPVEAHESFIVILFVPVLYALLDVIRIPFPLH